MRNLEHILRKFLLNELSGSLISTLTLPSLFSKNRHFST